MVFVNSVWVVIYGAIFLSHGRHASDRSDPDCLWHAGHAGMAIAMAGMFLPMGEAAMLESTWAVLFSVLAVMFLARTMLVRFKTGRAEVVWLLLVIDMLSMVYMDLLPEVSFWPLSYVLIGYFAWESYAWFSGKVDMSAADRACVPPEIALGVLDVKNEAPALHASAGLSEHRLSLCMMSAGMAYMLGMMTIG